jgi:hypothetical protein
MWMQVALWGGGIAVTALVVVRLLRRRATRTRIDVGAVSDAWLAEHRGRRQDPWSG